MLRGWKRLLACLLTALLVLNSLPAPALAAILDNTPAQNEEILSQLEGLVGSEDEAERYYSLMERYGLLDEDGNAVDSWRVTMDGEDVTVEELRATLEGDYDPQKVVTVDGTPVTLADLDTMVQIEDYIAYLQETYFSEHEWTQEQIDALNDLRAQVQESGIELMGVNGELEFPSGTDHTQRVVVPESVSAENGKTVDVEISLAHPAKSEVSFDWSIAAGNISGTAGELIGGGCLR